MPRRRATLTVATANVNGLRAAARKDMAAWENGGKWTVADGVATVGKGQIVSKQPFGDCQVHVEFRMPSPPTGKGQGRGSVK